MLNLRQLGVYRDSFQVKIDSNRRTVYKNIKPYYAPPAIVHTNNFAVKKYSPLKPYKNVLGLIPADKRIVSIQTARSQVNSLREVLKEKETFNKDTDSRVRGFLVEYYKKFTLSASCLLLFFIGAPLGAIIRRGGLGLPVVMSVLFFLLYHIISTVGEKSVKQGTIDPMLGMWISIIVLTPLGIFLTYKATVDSALFDPDFYKQLILKILPGKKDEQHK